jgi:putative endonuclease
VLNEIQKMLKAEPFVPFVVTTKNGNARPVAHPEKTLVGQYLVLMDEAGLFEIIHPNAITSLAIKGEGFIL